MSAFSFQIEPGDTKGTLVYAVFTPDGSEYSHGATLSSKKELTGTLKKICDRLNLSHGCKKPVSGRSPNDNGQRGAFDLDR